MVVLPSHCWLLCYCWRFSVGQKGAIRLLVFSSSLHYINLNFTEEYLARKQNDKMAFVNFCTKEGKANSESSIEVTIQQKWFDYDLWLLPSIRNFLFNLLLGLVLYMRWFIVVHRTKAFHPKNDLVRAIRRIILATLQV